MSHPLRGHIYLVRLPGHPRDLKTRPAVVVSLDARNRFANDFILVPLTSTLRPAPTHVELPVGEGGLRKTSMAKCEQISTLDKSLLAGVPLGGPIRTRFLLEIEKAILRSIGILIP